MPSCKIDWIYLTSQGYLLNCSTRYQVPGSTVTVISDFFCCRYLAYDSVTYFVRSNRMFADVSFTRQQFDKTGGLPEKTKRFKIPGRDRHFLPAFSIVLGGVRQ